jgi:hypothetical protein
MRGKAMAVIVVLVAACSDSQGSNPVGRLVLSPPWTSIDVGVGATRDTVRATFINAAGATVRADSVQWSSSNTGVASITAAGLIRARAVGQATIRGTVGAEVASRPITITDPVLIGAGDIASCLSDRDGATAMLIDSLAGTVLTLGDNDYSDGTPTPAYGICYDSTWGRHKPRTHPAPGDDDRRGGTLGDYFTYFGAAAHGPTGYHSYDLGSWHIVVLNTTPFADSTQVRWLRDDLAAHPNLCTLAISHRPRFSSGNTHSAATQGPVFQPLYDAHAEILLSGNDHDYERFAPQAPDQTSDPDSGVVQFVVGTGGKSHGTINLPLEPSSAAQNDDSYGVLKLTLHPTGYDWRFIPVAGRTFSDAGSASCH